ncbi:MAG: deoxyribodipyrimidine photolyase [Rhodobacteraceae bacterium]|nr:deoxyribodipyrimidine photolyase [Paracoccaceae bacterium]
MNVLVWFKRDLRVEDHPALALAAGLGAVLPLYIVEPDHWRQPDTATRQWEFIAESLGDLRGALAGLGAPLVVRVGTAVSVLEKLCKAHAITRILSHEETGNLWSFARDRAVADWARRAGIDWTELPQQGVRRRGPARAAFLAQGPVPAPAALTPLGGVEPGLIPTARALRLAEDRCPHRQAGGRVQGLALLDSFLAVRGRPYRAALSSPVTGERGCSRLSPHFAHGTLSGREVAAAVEARLAARPGAGWGGSLAAFRARLSQRDHLLQVLEDRPEVETACLNPMHAHLRPRDADATRLAAWAVGETGFPFVDACLRYLRATGWLNARARGMVMSVATQHLWLDWRDAGLPLARMFTDYEPGIHWPQTQLQAGTLGIDGARIVNPVKEGQDHDPTGAFTRRWVPELAEVPDLFLQQPWRWPGSQGFLGRKYPEPLVDLAAAARAARATVQAVRRDAADPPRPPRAKPAVPGQLSLGF